MPRTKSKTNRSNIPEDLKQWRARVEELETLAQARMNAKYFDGDGCYFTRFKFKPGDSVVALSQKDGFYYLATVDRYRGAVKIDSQVIPDILITPAGSDGFVPTLDVQFPNRPKNDSVEVFLENELFFENTDCPENDFGLLSANAWNEFRRELRRYEGSPDQRWAPTWSLSKEVFTILEENWQDNVEFVSLKMSFDEYCGKVLGHYRRPLPLPHTPG